MSIFRWRYWMGIIAVLALGGVNCSAQVDTDGDGFTDQQENFLHTSPTDALSYPGAHTNGFSLATNMIYVAKNGLDTNPGTAASPYLTIQKAATTAKTKSAVGIGSTITIMPGSYGESILYKADTADLVAPVVFTAATNGTVAITGADVWTNGWSNLSGNIYFHQWTNTWGFGTVPAGGWPGTIHSNADMCLRGEIVLVNGNLYSQVPTQATLTNGTYFVDEPNQKLYVQHRAGVVESSAFYEVTQRTNLMMITKNNGKLVGNIKLQGLEFRMAGDQLVAPAVEVFGATNVLVDTCLFDYNNWVAINFDFGTNITIRNTVASHNGAMGIQMGNTQTNIVIDGCETDFNNWRGFPANFTGFAIAGIKLLKIHTGLIRNHIAVGNFTYGLWFDFDNQDIFVDGCVHAGNLLTGLQFEGTPGPVWVQNGITMRGYGKDGQLGLLAQNTEKLTVTNYAIFSSMNVNGSGAMGCTVSTSRIVTNWATLVPVTLFSSNWTLKDNMFRFGGTFQYGIDMFTNFPSFTNTLSSDFNHFCNFFQYTNVFTLNGSKGGSAWKTNLVQWQTLTGQDLHSESNNLQRLCTVTQDAYILPGNATAHGTATNAVCDTAPDGAGALNNVILLKFDTSSLTNIPREAELKLTAINVSNNSNPPIFAVYRMTTDWDENATGLQAKSGANWHDGGSFNASDYDQTPIRFGQCITNLIDFGTFNTFVDVTPVAQQWAAGTAPNFGVAIIAEPTWDQPVSDGSNYRKFEILTHNTTLTNVWPVLAAQEGQTPAGACPAITVSPATLPDAVVSIPYSQAITAAGSSATPFTFTNNGALPNGMTLTSQGTLSGTATMSGTTVFTVKATDTNSCFGSNVYTFVIQPGCSTINVAPTLLPTGAVNWVYSGVVTGSGGTFPYTFTSAGTLPNGVSMSSAGVFSGRATASGSFVFNVKATDSSGICAGSNNVTIVISATGVCPSITLSPAGLLATATVNVAYGPQAITASGGNGLYSYTNSAGTLPPGLTVSSGGVLSGTPTSLGSFGFTVKATDTNSCIGTTNYTLVVSCPTITLPASVLATGRVGIVYNTQTITASGGLGPYVFTNIVGTLPPGLTLSSGGTITGTPTLNVTNTFTVRATDQDGCIGSNNYTIVIQPPCPTITVLPVLFPTGTVGVAYSQTNTASGGFGSYTFTNTAGALPNGLALSTNGVLSGIPLADGSFTFTVQATDGNGCTGSTNCTMVAKLGVGAVFLDFNAGATDFTGNFYSNGGVFTWNSTVGVTNSGGVKVSTTDETAIYRSNRWNLSTNGASITLSSFIRSTNSGASVQNALGVSTTTNGQFKSTSTGSWLTFFISTQSGFSQAKMGYQYKSQGATSANSNLATFVLLSTNWYKWSVTFTTTNGVSGLGTGNVTLENYGAKGTNSLGAVVQTNGVSFGTALQDVFQSKTNYPGIRAWSASGMAGFDNWSVTAP